MDEFVCVCVFFFPVSHMLKEIEGKGKAERNTNGTSYCPASKRDIPAISHSNFDETRKSSHSSKSVTYQKQAKCIQLPFLLFHWNGIYVDLNEV